MKNNDILRFVRAMVDSELSTAPRFSIAAALRAAADGGLVPGSPEAVALRQHAETVGRAYTPTSFDVPFGLIGRDMTTQNTWSVVNLTNDPARDLLREVSLIGRCGAEILSASGGPVTVPFVTAEAAGTWLSDEFAACTPATPTTGQVSLSPRLAACIVRVSHTLLKQSDADRLISAHLAGVIGRMLDIAAVRGSGVAGEPHGIVGTSGVGSFAIDATNTHADALNAVAALRGNQASATHWLLHPDDAATLSARERASGGGTFVLDANTMAGVEAVATTAVTAGTAVLADMRRLVVAVWHGGLQLMLDPYSAFSSGVVQFRATLAADVAAIPPSAFSVGTVA